MVSTSKSVILNMIDIQVVLVLILVILFYILITKKDRNFSNHIAILPLGPRGLLFLGNLFQLSKNTPLKLSNWADKYGKLFTINIGYGKPALVVSCPIIMNKIFGKQAATGKFRLELMDILYGGQYGVGNSEGNIWKEQHAFCATILRKFGLGKSPQVESMVLVQLEILCGSILEEMQTMSRAIHLDDILKKATTKIIWSILTGQQMSTYVISHLLDKWRNAIQVASKSGLAFFPWVKYIAPERSGYKRYVKAVDKMHEYLEAQLRNYMIEINRNGPEHQPNNIVSAYLKHTVETEDKTSSFYGAIGYQHSFHSILALLIGGAETTALALNWIIFYLTVHPQVQNLMQREIDQVINGNCYPTLDDKSRMPYTQAVIEESFRMSSIAPLGVTHRLLEDVHFKQYRFPEGLLLIPNIYHVHNDKKIWNDPQNFRPERFLEESSKPSRTKVLRDSVTCFQSGKRKCVGEPMARDLIFLSVTALLKTFDFSPENGRLKSDYENPDVGWFMVPNHIPVVVSRRMANRCVQPNNIKL